MYVVGCMCVHVCESAMELDWWRFTPATLLDYKLFYMVLGSKLKHGEPSSLPSHLSSRPYMSPLGSPRSKPWLTDECEVVHEEVQEVLRVWETDGSR